jgi:alkylation response protein AidB-like acyl-CoA dehydrogenase
MDCTFTLAERIFREEVRTWLEEHAPKEPRPNDLKAAREFDLAWQRTQFEGGWAGISWPAEYGGRGLSLVQQLIWYEEYARARAPYIGLCFVGTNHAGPTLIAQGSQGQKEFHLPRILRGEVVWCQGFSEPSAGSDLASLRTTAEIDGDHLVVTGHKIWTSYGHLAEYQELLVRTDRAAAKHRGITWVIGDMRAPGIVVRPITTMAGDPHFCEVIYDHARIPLANVVGRINDGWAVAMSTLAFERGTAFMAEQVELARVVEELIDLARSRGRSIQSHDLGPRLATLRAEVAALRAMAYVTVSRGQREAVPGPEASIIKLYHSELHQRVYRMALDVMGPEGLERSQKWTKPYLVSFNYTIAAGTSEVQRNIIGERLLGLPKGR